MSLIDNEEKDKEIEELKTNIRLKEFDSTITKECLQAKHEEEVKIKEEEKALVR